ncbi:MAG: DEAD/DEAH box helicase [Flavobacteriales bacterium]|nr:DEAD/DEAH box helicase [Flavobacteriales bacterium]
MGFETATPVQEQTIPVIMKGQDIIACAQTGTGKTAAFLIPVLNHIMTTTPKEGVRALIIVPTRELAIQIDNELQGFSYFTSCTSLAVYGGGDGADFDREKKALKEGADFIIATPGRMKSHMSMGYANVKHLEFLILDEADRMLDMGFAEDIAQITSYLPEKRQNLLFSATFPPKIRTLAKELLHDPAEVSISISKPAEGVMQVVYLCYDKNKEELIGHLLKGKDLKSVIVFASRKTTVSSLARRLKKMGLNAAPISSDLDQTEREEVLRQFRAKRLNILVATDIMARGIDIKEIELVINYEVPGDAEDYVHRVGRTARAETTGIAITLVNQEEQRKFEAIEQLIDMEIMKQPTPQHIGETPDWNPRSGGGGRNRKGNKPFKRKGKPKKARR